MSRPDVDWRHWASYLRACGLARPLAPALQDAELARWTPAFFTEALRAAAVRDGILELVQQEVLRQVGRGLRSIGARGVLLKGMALKLLAREHGVALPTRATGDLDVRVGAEHGPALRRRLLELGFRGDPDARPTSPHHLAPVVLQGVSVEIHTRIVAPFWGLPEAEMLGRVRPLAAVEGLDTLDAEGLLLHAVIHCSQNCFSHGLRAAWDVLAILRTFPGLDWNRLARWVTATRVPRGFWVPAAVLSRELGLPLPPDFLRRAPRDALQRNLEAVAGRRLFRVVERMGELDAISRNALLLLLHDSLGARGRYLGALCRWAAVRPRGRAKRSGWPSQPQAGRLGQAWRHLVQYRRVVARAVADED